MGDAGVSGQQVSSDVSGQTSDFVAPSTGRFEEAIIRTLCEPILVRLPASVTPNSISLVTHVIVWATAYCAILSATLPHPYKSLALVAAGVGMLLQMIGDCLDGMHARRTNQCSRLGEMMDHWLDANVVPLVTVGLTMALGMSPWAIVLVNVTATMVYQAQLVLYNHTGKFIHPEPANGVEAQFGVAMGYGALGALFYFVDRDARWLDVALALVAGLAVFVQMRCNWFYYPKLGKFIGEHLLFAGYLLAFGALYLSGAMDVMAFLSTLVFTSFRISGSYVLYTLLKRPYSGVDVGLLGSIALIAASHFLLVPAGIWGATVHATLPYLASAYLVGRNLLDFARHYAEIIAPNRTV